MITHDLVGIVTIICITVTSVVVLCLGRKK